MRESTRRRHLTLASIDAFRTSISKGLDPEFERNWYSRLPGIDTAEELARMEAFFDTNLDSFIAACADIFSILTEDDIHSIGTRSLTKNAIHLIDLLNLLREAGFADCRDFGKPHCFWSGDTARRLAYTSDHILSDMDVPAINVLFALNGAIQSTAGHYSSFNLLLCCAFSKLFAMQASSIAHVFLSSEKASELAGINMPNNFWLAELPTLQARLVSGDLDDIQVHQYDAASDSWLAPTSLTDPADWDRLPLYRRSANNDNKPTDDLRFKWLGMSKEDRARWRASEARPSITYGTLKRTINHWRLFTTHSTTADVGAGVAFMQPLPSTATILTER